ncbi:MAG TPA: secretin N-terminal domain-containing protein [Candidatus Rifleibacterium sp.]|nr:secretin N-terminal domain-containing protein [Candidatus Rifleibacterium sp.]
MQSNTFEKSVSPSAARGGSRTARTGVRVLAMAFAATALLLPITGDHAVLQAQSGSLQNAEIGPRITINVRDISAEAAIGLIADHFGYRPEIQIPLDEKVSLDLENATFEQAMMAAIGKQPVDYMTENNRLHVFKPRETWSRFSDMGPDGMTRGGAPAKPAEPKVSRIVPLGKRKAEDLQKLLKELNPTISVVFDSPTNSLILLGEESQVNEAESLCQSLDEMPVTERQAASAPLVLRQQYITQVFELEHADMVEVEKELGTVIQRQESGTSGNNSTTGTTQLRDKDGKPIETEYFVIDKARRIVLVHTTEEKFAVVKKYFDSINKPLPQVLIETQIVAVDSDFERNLGIKWNTDVAYRGPGNPWSSAGDPPAVTPDQAILPGPQAFQFGKWDLRSLQGLLNTAETNNKAQVLSRPRIMALTGRQASIHVGTELPYTTSTTITDGGNVTQNVEFKQIGVKLDVTPTIHTLNKTIRLHLIPEVSDSIGQAANGAPIISTRRSETTVELKDGDTMVIGGLISSEDSKGGGGVPMLRNIPVIGKLFQFSKKTKKKTNLIILLTTRLVNEGFENTVKPAVVEQISVLHGHPAIKGIEGDIASITEVINPDAPAVETVAEPADKPAAVTAAKTVVEESGIPGREEKLKGKEYLQKRLRQVQETLHSRSTAQTPKK